MRRVFHLVDLTLSPSDGLEAKDEDGCSSIFLLGPTKPSFCLTQFISVLTLLNKKVAIGATRLLFLNRVSETALIIKRRTAALIAAIYIWPTTTLSSSIYSIINRIVNDTVVRTGQFCVSTAHISVASIINFPTISAPRKSHFFLNHIRACLTIVFTACNWTYWSTFSIGFTGLSIPVEARTFPALFFSWTVLSFLKQCSRWFPASTWSTMENSVSTFGNCSCPGGSDSSLAS